MKDCKNCEYRKAIARMFDIHVWDEDCWIECDMKDSHETDAGGLKEDLEE